MHFVQRSSKAVRVLLSAHVSALGSNLQLVLTYIGSNLQWLVLLVLTWC